MYIYTKINCFNRRGTYRQNLLASFQKEMMEFAQRDEVHGATWAPHYLFQTGVIHQILGKSLQQKEQLEEQREEILFMKGELRDMKRRVKWLEEKSGEEETRASGDMEAEEVRRLVKEEAVGQAKALEKQGRGLSVLTEEVRGMVGVRHHFNWPTETKPSPPQRRGGGGRKGKQRKVAASDSDDSCVSSVTSRKYSSSSSKADAEYGVKAVLADGLSLYDMKCRFAKMEEDMSELSKNSHAEESTSSTTNQALEVRLGQVEQLLQQEGIMQSVFAVNHAELCKCPLCKEHQADCFCFSCDTLLQQYGLTTIPAKDDASESANYWRIAVDLGVQTAAERTKAIMTSAAAVHTKAGEKKAKRKRAREESERDEED
jgi:hypothetical protein